MRVKSFRVKNYKSIKDSGICYVQPDMTILAGKNESGKTALLQALRDFDRKIKAVSIDSVKNKESEESTIVSIEVSFLLSEEERNDLIAVMQPEYILSEELEKALQIGTVSIIKSFDEQGKGTYSFEEKIKDLFNKQEWAVRPEFLIPVDERIRRINNSSSHPLIDEVTFSNNTFDIKNEIETILAKVRKVVLKSASSELKTLMKESINELENICLSIDKNSAAEFALSELQFAIPSFAFFSDFDDLLPNEISLDEAEQHSAIQNFQTVTGFSVKTLKEKARIHDRSTYCDKYSEKFTQHFNDEWHQAEVQLKVRYDSGRIAFSIVETNSVIHYDIKDRSKGFQWFLAFYLMLDAVKADNKVILIDEPGLYLHEKAQKNILNVLEKHIAPQSQIIFSTHSPYLIHPSELQRVRLVIRNNVEGTQVENSPHKSPDAESLAPVHTAIIEAIGHAPSQGVAAQYNHNVILEGVSDYYFITAMARILDDKIISSKVKLIPSTGATNTALLASLFTGWSLDYVVILDNDGEGQKTARLLEKKCLAPKIITVPFDTDEGRCAMEDLFSPEDFKAFVIPQDIDLQAFESSASNSFIFDRLAKDQKLTFSKPLGAKQFYEKAKADNPTLSPISLDNFRKLFEAIKQQLNLSTSPASRTMFAKPRGKGALIKKAGKKTDTAPV